MALYRKLNRETRIRRSILSSLTKDVLTNGHVNTTEQRAKEVRKFVDKMITYAKKGDLNSRRKALAFLNNDNALGYNVSSESTKYIHSPIAYDNPRFLAELTPPFSL